MIPIHNELIGSIAILNLALPTRVLAGGAFQLDAMSVPTVDDQLGTDIGGINQMDTRKEPLVAKPLMNICGAQGFMNGRRGRMDVGE